MKNASVLILALGAFVAGSAELIIGGILRPFADDFGISIAMAGQAITAFSLAFAIGTPIVVALTSRVARKSLLLYAMALFAIGSLLTAWSRDFGMLLMSRAVVGLASGVFTVVAFGSVGKLVEPSRVGQAVGTVALGVSVSMVVGIPLGIAVADWWSWREIFSGMTAAALVVMALAAKRLPKIEGDVRMPFFRQFAVLGNPVIAAGFAFSFFFSSSSSAMNSYVTPYLQSVVGLSTKELGYTMLALGLSSVLGSRAGGRWTDRWGTNRTMFAGIATLGASLAILPPLGEAAWPSISVLLIWMFSMAAAIPAIQTYFIQRAPENANLVLGLNTSVLHLGVAAGAGLGGLAAAEAGTVQYHPWLACAAALISMGMAAASVNAGRKKAGEGIARPAASNPR